MIIKRLDLGTVLYFLSLVLYNSSYPVLRILLVVYFVFFSFFLFFSKTSFVFCKRLFPLILSSVFYSLYTVVLFLFNGGFDSVNLTSHHVEMLTPILYITVPFAIVAFYRFETSALFKIWVVFSVVYLFFLTGEMVYRYFLESECFMNYNCRYQAKSLGYFSTTNALASSFVVFLLTNYFLLVTSFFRRALPFFILLSSMSRAAIIGYFIVRSVIVVFRQSLFRKLLAAIVLTTSLLYLFYIDVLGFLHDGSFLSKFAFIGSMFDLVLNTNDYRLFFGYGSSFDQAVTALGVNGWSPHNPLVKAFVYHGLIGLMLYCSTIFSMILIDSKVAVIVFLYLLVGFAGAPIFFPSLLLPVIMFSKKREEVVSRA